MSKAEIKLIAWAILAITLFSMTTYLYIFADCSVVKHYWYLTQTPGRCL